MPFALIIVGIVLLVAGVRDTQTALFTLVKGDFLGQNNFIYWALSILIIGSLGYVPKLQPLSRAFLVLIVVGLFLSKQGFFAQFQTAINSTVALSNPSGVGAGLQQQSNTGTSGLSTTLTSGVSQLL